MNSINENMIRKETETKKIVRERFNLKIIFSLIGNSFDQFLDDKGFKMAAALSFYSAFSLTPMLIIIIAIAGLVFGEDAVRGQIVGQIQNLVGHDGAVMIETMIKGASAPSKGIIAAIFSFIVLILGSVGVFLELQESLNIIWGVEQKPGRGIKGLLKNRLSSFSMVISTAFILLVSLIVNAALSALQNYMGAMFYIATIMIVVNFIVSFSVITLMFALIFKYLPDVILKWRFVFMGAVITSVLFSIGKFAIGTYLGNNSYSSTYGAAASLVILLMWIYYSGLILYFGAEFTQVYTKKYTVMKIIPDKDAFIIPKISELIKKETDKKQKTVSKTD
jgi:membrane protein